MESERGHILSLPPELLLLIFESLSNLYEPFCLAKTCKQLYRLFQDHETGLSWSIISASDYHKYDAPLCWLADAIHSEDEDITLRLPSLLSSTSLNRLNYCLDYDFKALSATNYSIDTRNRYLRQIRLWWKQANQLRFVFISQFDRYKHALSYHSPYNIDRQQRENYMVACYADCEDQLGGKLFPLPRTALPRTEEEKLVSQERFYRAIMGRALDTKALQFLAIFKESEKPEESEIARRTYVKLINMWSGGSDRTLQESFEILEIFDYTSNFLLFSVFGPPMDYLDWVEDTHISDTMDGRHTILGHWMSFHVRLQSFLTPFDILCLFKGKYETKGEVSQYLLNFLLRNTVDTYGYVPGMREIEDEVSSKLSGASPGAWKAYRSYHWRSAIRGRVFSDMFDASDYSVECKEVDNWLWWKELERVESRPPRALLSIPVLRFLMDQPQDRMLPAGEANHPSLHYFYILDDPLDKSSRT